MDMDKPQSEIDTDCKVTKVTEVIKVNCQPVPMFMSVTHVTIDNLDVTADRLFSDIYNEVSKLPGVELVSIPSLARIIGVMWNTTYPIDYVKFTISIFITADKKLIVEFHRSDGNHQFSHLVWETVRLFLNRHVVVQASRTNVLTFDNTGFQRPDDDSLQCMLKNLVSLVMCQHAEGPSVFTQFITEDITRLKWFEQSDNLRCDLINVLTYMANSQFPLPVCCAGILLNAIGTLREQYPIVFSLIKSFPPIFKLDAVGRTSRSEIDMDLSNLIWNEPQRQVERGLSLFK